MKSFRCWDEIPSPLNLWLAWRDFERGKRRRPDVAAFSVDADREVHRLARELAAGSYRPAGYRLLRIVDPKRRIVAAAPVRDRVVHHALHRVLAPRWNRSFAEVSYACLPGRGSHRAILRFQAGLRRYRWVLQLDVRRYFYSVDRAILRRVLVRRLPELELAGLIDRILDSGRDMYADPEIAAWLGWEAPGAPGRGLPIGNLTSQWWGNVYLDALDHYACRELRLPAYQRYMDDFTLFGDDAEQLVAAREELGRWLRQERGLELKDPAARPIRCCRRQEYLGYRITRGRIEPGRKARERLPARLAALVNQPKELRAAIAAAAAVWNLCR